MEPKLSPLAGKPAPKSLLVDPARLEREYYQRKPDELLIVRVYHQARRPLTR